MMAENIVNLNQTIEYMMNIEANCDIANENTPMEYYNFVINDFYLPLIQTDMTEMDSFWGSVEFGPLGTFEAFDDEGVMCLKGTHQRDLMAVQVVLKVYLEMAQLHMAIIHEEMERSLLRSHKVDTERNQLIFQAEKNLLSSEV